MTMDFCCLLFI